MAKWARSRWQGDLLPRSPSEVCKWAAPTVMCVADPRKPDLDAETVRDIADRALPGTGRPIVERAHGGASTQVYRVHRDGTTLFVRIAEDAEDSMAMEAWVHLELRRRGVRVPGVVSLVLFDDRIRRSIMVTTEIPGRSVHDEGTDLGLGGVLVDAGSRPCEDRGGGRPRLRLDPPGRRGHVAPSRGAVRALAHAGEPGRAFSQLCKNGCSIDARFRGSNGRSNFMPKR